MIFCTALKYLSVKRTCSSRSGRTVRPAAIKSTCFAFRALISPSKSMSSTFSFTPSLSAIFFAISASTPMTSSPFLISKGGKAALVPRTISPFFLIFSMVSSVVLLPQPISENAIADIRTRTTIHFDFFISLSPFPLQLLFAASECQVYYKLIFIIFQCININKFFLQFFSLALSPWWNSFTDVEMWTVMLWTMWIKLCITCRDGLLCVDNWKIPIGTDILTTKYLSGFDSNSGYL